MKIRFFRLFSFLLCMLFLSLALLGCGNVPDTNTLKSIELSQSELTMSRGEEKQITVTFTPLHVASQYTSLVWTSQNQDVAYVRPDGTIVACGAGTTVISAKARHDASICDEVIVTVTNEVGRGIYFDDNNCLLVTSESEIDLKTLVLIVDLEISAEDLVFTLESYYETDQPLLSQGIFSFAENGENSPVVTIKVSYENYSDVLRMQYKPSF